MPKRIPGEDRSQIRPAPYSNTDAAEIEAVTTLRSLLDSRRVRPDLRERDKFPNIDGYVELVDEGGHPLGKIEVQIKKLPSGVTSCPCPSSLVAYSKVTTLPVILVGVDPSNSRAYWTHVSELMPGYNSSQRSFTVHFTDAVDAVDTINSCPCYRRWLELTSEYQERIQRYPLFEADAGQGVTLASLTPQRLDALQRYVDTINHLLDDDFVTVKRFLFPRVWKFGVGCRLIDQETVLCQISGVPMGKPAPLVVGLPESVTFRSLGQNVHTLILQPQKEFFGFPERNGRDFVFRFVQDLVRAKAFPVYGMEMAVDVLLGFVKRYHRWLELTPDMDEYQVEDLRRAFGPGLSKTTGSVAGRLSASGAGIRVVNLDLMINQMTNLSAEGRDKGWTPTSYVLSSNICPIRSSFESLALLSSLGVLAITQRFRSRDLDHQSPPNNLIWSCYSRQRETDNVTELLKRVIGEYEVFVHGNAFQLESSPYLDRTTSVVFEYVSFYDNPVGQGPVLHECHLRDPHRALEKTSVFVAGASSKVAEARPGSSIVINNVRFEVTRVVSRSADFFFGHSPLSNLIYRLLADDLRRQYKMTVR